MRRRLAAAAALAALTVIVVPEATTRVRGVATQTRNVPGTPLTELGR